MSNLPATQSNMPPVLKMLEGSDMRKKMSKALPSHLKPERFCRIMLTCIRQNPKLGQCDQMSLLGAMFELAQLGLEPNTPLGHAYLIPFGSKVQILLGYKGYISLADRSGILLNAEVAYQSEVDSGNFAFGLGLEPWIKHTPDLESNSGDRGELAYAYATAILPDGRRTFKVIGRADIQDAKSASSAWQLGQKNPSKRDSPWYKNEAAMWRKTAIRRLTPFLAMSPELAQAQVFDDDYDAGRPQAIDVPDFVDSLPPAQKMESLENKLEDVKNVASKEQTGQPQDWQEAGGPTEVEQQTNAPQQSATPPPPPTV